MKGCKENSTCYLFSHLGHQGSDIGDSWAGVILLVLSLLLLCSCLMGMVRLLNSLLGDKVRATIERGVNRDLPVRGLGWLTGYLAMVVGAVLTVLVQSSSVFTSTLTPLAGAGLVTLTRAYPLTLGSNIGTTSTSLLAALAAGGQHAQSAIQIALVHLMFNIIGILVFYPIPFMRWPIALAQVCQAGILDLKQIKNQIFNSLLLPYFSTKLLFAYSVYADNFLSAYSVQKYNIQIYILYPVGN